jgi:hypothetical protein
MAPALSTTIPSFSGIRAAFFGSFLAASSSSSAWEVVMTPWFPRSGSSSGVQPSVGSRKSSMRALSLPLTSFLAPGIRALLAALSCAVRPVAGLSSYYVSFRHREFLRGDYGGTSVTPGTTRTMSYDMDAALTSYQSL